MKNFNQPAPAFGPYDNQAPRVKPDTSTPARLTAVDVEDEIRNNPLETGVFIAPDGSVRLRREGLANQVGFTNLELMRQAGTTFTHNHPGNGTFSLQDYALGLDAGVHELRAVSPAFRHILQYDGQMPNPVTVDQQAALLRVKLSEKIADKVKVGQLHPNALLLELQHQVWQTLAKHYKFTYFRESS